MGTPEIRKQSGVPESMKRRKKSVKTKINILEPAQGREVNEDCLVLPSSLSPLLGSVYVKYLWLNNQSSQCTVLQHGTCHYGGKMS